ncbi:RNA 2',3'-cyclic phosphodiesterase [archaeon HR01]|nr:RNA 2',3'-cyclic phosphodiesterase [archaeon HR01]
MRLFIAVDIVDQNVVENIRTLQKTLLDTRSAELRPVPPENLHITLKFLGEVDDEIAGEIGARLNLIEYQPFKVRLKGLGYFPGGGYINVIWVGMAEGAVQLKGLYTLVEDTAQRLGFRRDSFSPHLTICRVKSVRDKRLLLQTLEKFSEYEVGEEEVSELKLKRSVLTPSGPVYSDLVVKRL